VDSNRDSAYSDSVLPKGITLIHLSASFSIASQESTADADILSAQATKNDTHDA
jgi:hypothetical protein